MPQTATSGRKPEYVQFGLRSALQLASWQPLLLVIDMGMLNPSTTETIGPTIRQPYTPSERMTVNPILTVVIVRLAVEC